MANCGCLHQAPDAPRDPDRNGSRLLALLPPLRLPAGAPPTPRTAIRIHRRSLLPRVGEADGGLDGRGIRALGVPRLLVRQQQSMRPAIQHRLAQRHSASSFKGVLNPGVNPAAIGPVHGVAIEAFRFSKPVRLMLLGPAKIHAPVLDDLAGLAVPRKIPGLKNLSEARSSD